MGRKYISTAFRKILIPVLPGSDCQSALTIARAIASEGRIKLVGLVGIPEGQPISAASSLAKDVRKDLQRCAIEEGVRIRERVRVSYKPWEELAVILDQENPDILILEWSPQFKGLIAGSIDDHADINCDIAVFRGPFSKNPRKILAALRGNIYAEQALRLSLAVARNCHSSVTSLRVNSPDAALSDLAPFRGLELVLKNLPEVKQMEIVSSKIAQAIIEQSSEYDLVVLGTSTNSDLTKSLLGRTTDKVLSSSKCGVIAVRTTRRVQEDLNGEQIGHAAISILVDKWFAENTYFASEFEDLELLLAQKQRQGLRVSLALPALNEEKTIGQVIEKIKTPLMDRMPILDEIVLMDSNSTDRTREIAAEYDVPVYIHQEILPQFGARAGKGEALWKSIFVTSGDIILWIDTDIVNIQPHFIYGLLGPFLLRENTQFVKGFYRRPIKIGTKIQAGGGGRVTELAARPLLNLFYPELSGIIQPLSGEYGGRRSALERLHFSSGYGVEIGLLIDIFERFGLSSISQVDLLKRVHRNQPLHALSKMSFEIIQTVARRLEHRYGWQILEEVNRSMKVIRFENRRLFLEVEKISEQERPPMIEIPEYLDRI